MIDLIKFKSQISSRGLVILNFKLKKEKFQFRNALRTDMDKLSHLNQVYLGQSKRFTKI